jgi:hypothetical protein
LSLRKRLCETCQTVKLSNAMVKLSKFGIYTEGGRERILSLACFTVHITAAMNEHPSDIVLGLAPLGETLQGSEASEGSSLPIDEQNSPEGVIEGSLEPGLGDLTNICRASVTLRADALLAFTLTEMERVGNEAVQLTLSVSALNLVSDSTLYFTCLL